jgi:hypothetical protein
VAVLDPSLEQRLRDSRLRKDPLALVPLASVVALPIAYIYASGYELGRADRFGIPRSMVSVDLRSSLVPFIWLLFMIFCTVPFLYQVQQRGFPATGLVIAKRLRGLFFLIEAVAAIGLILQRQFTLGFGLTALGGLYVILYGIPALLGRLYTMLRRPVRRRYLNRRIRQMLSALRQHIFGEPWARQSLRFQVAYGTFVLVVGIILLPYGIGNVAAVINQKYSVLGSANNQGNAQAIVGTYGDKVFIADVRRGVAQAVIVKNLDDVKDIEVGEAEFPGLALDLCRREPDQLSQILCLVAG